MDPPPKALVTGASRGIGRAIVEHLLAKGYSVVGLARSFSTAQPGERFHPVVLDLADLDRLAQEVDRLAASHCDVEVLVLVAGRGEFGSLEEFSYRGIRSLLDLNFTSQAYLARAFLPRMKRRGRGDVIFLGSEAALAGKRRGSVYCASKFAVRGFAQALREESAASGVRVTVVNPGMVRTGFFDRLNFGPGQDEENYVLPHDVAEAVGLVLSTRRGTVLDEVNLSPLKRVVRKKAKKPDADL